MQNSSIDAAPGSAAAGSHLTLHYRVSLADSGADVINTFVDRPATIQLGIGQMAEPLEQCLIGLTDGEHRVFELDAEHAFGVHNPELVQRLSRATFDENSVPGTDYEPGDVLEFPGPDGARLAGVLKTLDERYAMFDFNHPLAGHTIRFEVRILGVL